MHVTFLKNKNAQVWELRGESRSGPIYQHFQCPTRKMCASHLHNPGLLVVLGQF